MKSSISKTFASETKSLSEIRKFIEDFLKTHKVIEEEREKIILAIDEACTNKIKHAYHFNSSMKILVKLKIKKDNFIAEIIDWGEPFDPDSIPIPDISENMKNRKVGGFGIFLMKKLVDDIEYKFNSTGENILILRKKIRFEHNG